VQRWFCWLSQWAAGCDGVERRRVPVGSRRAQRGEAHVVQDQEQTLCEPSPPGSASCPLRRLVLCTDRPSPDFPPAPRWLVSCLDYLTFAAVSDVKQVTVGYVAVIRLDDGRRTRSGSQSSDWLPRRFRYAADATAILHLRRPGSLQPVSTTQGPAVATGRRADGPGPRHPGASAGRAPPRAVVLGVTATPWPGAGRLLLTADWRFGAEVDYNLGPELGPSASSGRPSPPADPSPSTDCPRRRHLTEAVLLGPSLGPPGRTLSAASWTRVFDIERRGASESTATTCGGRPSPPVLRAERAASPASTLLTKRGPDLNGSVGSPSRPVVRGRA